MIAATAEVHRLTVVGTCVISPGWGCRHSIRSGFTRGGQRGVNASYHYFRGSASACSTASRIKRV